MLKVGKKKIRQHSLTGRITPALMLKAFKAVKRNRGAAGIDKQSIRMFEFNLWENLDSLMAELKSGDYEPLPLKRVYIPKGKGKFRPLGIPAVRCRIAQEVVRLLINPIFEPQFHDHSHGFRSKRSCHTAMEVVVQYRTEGYRYVLDADIKGFFDNIPHGLIMDLIARDIADGNILSLVQKFLQAGVMEAGEVKPTRKGTPQGGIVSPLIANIVLNHLDWRLETQGYKFVRYADDFLLFCKSKSQAEKALEIVTQIIEEDLGLNLSPEKTHITTFGSGFNFLGFYVSAFTIRMGDKAEVRFKNKIRDITSRSHNLDAKIVVDLNRVIRGTVRYFSASFTTGLRRFNALDQFIRRRIRCMRYKRIWMTDNQRFLNKHICNRGFLTCREVYLSAS
jgi:group II intron reverse transcriptase/maturase